MPELNITNRKAADGLKYRQFSQPYSNKLKAFSGNTEVKI